MVPQTPERRSREHHAPLSTPRTISAIQTHHRHQLQTTATLTISHFTKFISELTASFSDDEGHRHLSTGGKVNERTRLDMIEQFREAWMLGEFIPPSTRRPPPTSTSILSGHHDEEDSFSEGTRRSSSAPSISSKGSALTSSPTPLPNRPRLMPRHSVDCGIMAEKAIKSDLKRRGVLLVDDDYAPLSKIVQRARRKAIRWGKPIYVAPGLLPSPNWADQYSLNGYANPGIRWGNFKPDLIRVEVINTKNLREESEPTVSFEVIEIKYREPSSARDTIFSSWKCQAIYYHLALSRILSAVANLAPSHRVCFWVSRNPHSATYTEKPLAVRTSLAFVEMHLFKLLPEWLEAITHEEWTLYEAKKDKLRLGQKRFAQTASSATPTATFLEKLLHAQPSKSIFKERPGTFETSLMIRDRSEPLKIAGRMIPALPDSDDVNELLFPPLPEQDDQELESLLESLSI